MNAKYFRYDYLNMSQIIKVLETATHGSRISTGDGMQVTGAQAAGVSTPRNQVVRLRCWARYTSPIPPAPIGATTS